MALAWLQQAWAQVHNKDLVDADPVAPGTGLTGHFDGESAAGSPASAPAVVATSPDTPLALEHVPTLGQVLVTGVLVNMLDGLDTLTQPAFQPAVPPVTALPSGLEELVAAQQMQMHDAASTIAAAAHAWLARVRLHRLSQAATAIAAIRRAMLARRAAAVPPPGSTGATAAGSRTAAPGAAGSGARSQRAVPV